METESSEILQPQNDDTEIEDDKALYSNLELTENEDNDDEGDIKQNLKVENSDHINYDDENIQNDIDNEPADSNLTIVHSVEMIQNINYKLEDHETLMTNKKNIFPCEMCSKSFSQNSNLATHIKHIHQGLRDYICDICSKQFKTNGSLAQHTLTHSSDRKFECTVCSKKFRDKYALSRHSLIHSGNKNQVCDLCNKTFYRTNDLTRHVRTFHMKVKNFKCTFCNKAFSNTGNLQAHVRIHTGKIYRNFYFIYFMI